MTHNLRLMKVTWPLPARDKSPSGTIESSRSLEVAVGSILKGISLWNTMNDRDSIVPKPSAG